MADSADSVRANLRDVGTAYGIMAAEFFSSAAARAIPVH
jgi:hypothetical protein